MLIKTHLIGVAASHHTSASRLGAQPTGHLAKAAERMTRSHDSDGGAINIYSPGFKRVFQAFTIFPRVAKALTIPIHPMAYGRRVSEVALMVKGVFRPKGTNILAYNDGDKLVPLYILVKKAFIPQDRSLLPSDSAMEQAVADGIRSGVRAAIERLGAA